MFELIRRTPLEEYDGEGLFYVHRETGMEVFHIRNNDSELTCSFMFSTPSRDSKGVAHIIEHTVLCGSRRFPVKDPFSQVLLSSPNTFLNAITFCDKTMYPFSSPLKKDFDILFDIYADAVFAPLLRKESFLQEGIRNFDGKFDGVVFNEMCGAMSTEESVVQTYSTKSLYEGTPYEFESGGDPLYIADLTYEEYLERYHEWYSPSNCRLFLFGNLEASEYLDKLESLYLKDGPKGNKIIPISENYLQKDMKSHRVRTTCPAGDASSVVLSWLTTAADDPFEVQAVSTLVDVLLGNSGAPLYKAITQSDLGEDLHPISGTDVEGPVLTMTVGFTHAKPDCEDRIEAFLLDQFRSYAENGIPQDAIDAAIKRQEFRIQEIQGNGLPYGMSVCLKAARCWMRGRNPEDGVKDLEKLRVLKERLSEGRFFENWIQRNILDNDRRCLLTVVSSEDYDNELQNRLQKKLENQLSMGLCCSAEDRKAYEDFVSTPDSPEALATIDRITVSDLPTVIAEYDQKLEKRPSGARLYDYRLFTRGVDYLSLAFDTRNLDLEQKRLLPLLLRTMLVCGTARHDFTQIGTMVKMLTGSFFMYPDSGADVQGKPVSMVVLKTKMLEQDFAQALDLTAEILLEPDLSDQERIKAALTDLLSEFESGYSYSANAYASMNAASVFSASAMESEILMGTALWFYLHDLKKALDEGKTSYSSLSAELTKLWKKVFVQRVMTVHIGSGRKDDVEKQLLYAFIDKFPVGKFVRTSDYYRSFTSPKAVGTASKPMVFTVGSGPAFNALAIRNDWDNEKDSVAAMLLTSVLSSGYLWNTVRGCNGAYGVESHVDRMENLTVFSSYRDPNISETFRVFLDSLCQDLDPAEVEYAIVAFIGKELRPQPPQTKCSMAFRRALFGMTTARYRRRRKILLSMTAEDLKEIGRHLSEIAQANCSATVVCGSEMARNLDCLKSIALPV